MKKFQSFGVIFLLFTFEFLLLTSCSVSSKISKSAKSTVLSAAPLKTAHIGISIYDPETGKYLYNYQGDKYFVPASNTKIPTCYAAMKYLGDSLVGLRYSMENNYLKLYPSGDPTFLHPDFNRQPVFDFLNGSKQSMFLVSKMEDDFQKYGSGWSWNDYNEYYMAERSVFPFYGNVFTIKFDADDSLTVIPDYKDKSMSVPMFLKENEGSSYVSRLKKVLPQGFIISRAMNANLLEIEKNKTVFGKQEIPIYNPDVMLPFYLREILGDKFVATTKILDSIKINTLNLKAIYTQPTDSLLKPMMHRSDNFFAEQSLLMVSNEHLGYMNDSKIIDTLLKTDFKDLPQKPRWADGSGLSRYNLFTPQDFVAILNKMKNEFGMERVKTIFPAGGEGTISSYYKAGNGYVYAKTGTLSGVVALSGFLYTKKGKLLIFSTLVNNHQASATEVRRAVERFIESLRKY